MSLQYPRRARRWSALIGFALVVGQVIAVAGPASAERGRAASPEEVTATPAVTRTGPSGAVASMLGNPYLTASSDATPESIAVDFVAAHSKEFKLTKPQLDQLVVASSYTTAHNGAQHVTLGQEIEGHRVANTGLTFAIDADGRVVSVAGRLARGPAIGRANVGPAGALVRAGQAAGESIPARLPATAARGPQLRFENTFADVRQPNDVTVEQVWYPTNNGKTVRLAWETDFELDSSRWLVTYVDASTGYVLDQTNRYAHAAPEGTVFTGQHPDDSDPRSVESFSGADGSWVDDRVTSGNNVNAYRDLNNDNTVGYRPQTPASGDAGYQEFNYTWTDAWRTNADGTGLATDLDAAITQLFYYTNIMHEWSYGFGFDEVSGNFQIDNFGRGGADSDPVLAEAQDGWDFGCLANDGVTPIRCQNNANFGTPADGASPRMQMYMWAPAGRPYREGSMDGDVIAHEFGHGISTRLVGGGDALGYGTHLVHASLGEGWSDVVSFLKWGDAVIAEYDTGNAATGIRRVAYDTSTHTYSDYNPNAASGHPNGEVWATMVYDIRVELGLATTTQLVFDGMKATPGLPEYMDARNGILVADVLNNGGANLCTLWRIFAERGLGVNATFSQASSVAPADNFDVAVDCIPNADAGGPYVTPEGTDVTLDASGSTEGVHPSGGAIVAYDWDFDSDGDYDDATGVAPTFTDVGDNRVINVGVQVTNAAGVTDEATSTVTVTNVAPSVSLDPVASTSENTSITLNGVGTDPGWEDDLTATVDWDDGNGPQALSGTQENVRPNATLTFSVDHTYGDNGLYSIEVCVDDDDGGQGCATTNVTISNTDPTAVIDEDVYIAHAGESVDVSANSTDPGSDDLTATWDWDDGATDIDVDLVNSPLFDPPKSPTIQPRDVDWLASHAYGEACRYDLGLLVVDDDGGFATDSAVVLVTGNDDKVWGSGWWKNQYRFKKPNRFTTPRLECYLEIVSYLSGVFDEARGPLVHRPHAVDILFVNKNRGSAEEIFEMHLLAAWLNFANGGFDLDTMVDTDGDGVADTTFEAAVAAAEAVRLDPTATRSELLAQKDILETIVSS